MSGDFTPEAYQDGYREALLSVIEAKTAGKEFVAPPTSAQPAPAMDLITALQASVEAAKAARGEPPKVPRQRKSGDKGKQASRRS
jgi:DNA end-binding protein Ku